VKKHANPTYSIFVNLMLAALSSTAVPNRICTNQFNVGIIVQDWPSKLRQMKAA